MPAINVQFYNFAGSKQNCSMQEYPIKFRPIFKEKIWGGKKLKEVLDKNIPSRKIGESWEISDVDADVSIVANGSYQGHTLRDLVAEHTADLVGSKNYQKFGNNFPLLIKFIDASETLSVQLHPDDELARKRHDSFGKKEMWYIIQADDAAEINVGFEKTVSEEEYLKHLQQKKITDLLHFEKVKKGDCFMINPGRIHAIGAGVLLAEIQQPSDVTYRVYDWDRKDDDGKERELHTDLALEAIDFEKREDFRLPYLVEAQKSSNIASNSFFTTNFLKLEKSLQKDLSALDSFVIYMCVAGSAEIELNGNKESLKLGETLLIPAQSKQVQINSRDCELLEVYIQ